MKKKYSILILLMVFQFSFSQKNENKKSSLTAIMNTYSDSLLSKKYGIVGLHKINGKTEKHAIGLSSLTEKMTTDKVFNIGSLTKTFTAVLVLQEVEKGNLKLSDSLGKFFPKKYLPNENVNSEITIEELLYHRSGLGELVNEETFNRAFVFPYYEYNFSFLFQKIPKPTSERNTKFEYCNTNYILLGYILEIINDLSYSDLIKTRVFDVCEMKSSYPYFSKSIKDIAHPMYEGEDWFDDLNLYFYKNFCFSAGGIASTLDDLEKFFDNLYLKNTLISKESFILMTTFKDGFGLGIEEIMINGSIFFGHGGDNISFKNRNVFNPETKELLILMSNHFKDKYIVKIGRDFFIDSSFKP